MTWVLPIFSNDFGLYSVIQYWSQVLLLLHSWKRYQGVCVSLVIILHMNLLKEKAPAWAINSTIAFLCGDINFLDHKFSFNGSSTKHIINLEDFRK